MKIEITDFINVEARVKTLGCNMPSGVTVLPQNFHSVNSKNEFIYESIGLQLRDTFRDNGLQGTSLEKNEKEPVTVSLRESATLEWIPLIIFVTSQFLQENPLLLNILSSFLYDKLKTMLRREPNLSDNVEFDMVVDISQHSKFKKVSYKGPLSGLKDIKNIIKNM